ncbi:MAG: hypothetical protein WCD89_03385 [Anaerocolumna sp.]
MWQERLYEVVLGRVLAKGYRDRDEFITLVDAYAWEFCLLQYNYLDENNQLIPQIKRLKEAKCGSSFLY